MSTPRRRSQDRRPPNQIADRNPLESLAIEPTHDDIARRAYQLYEARGREQGRDWEDWFQAECELRHVALQAVFDTIPATTYAAI